MIDAVELGIIIEKQNNSTMGPLLIILAFIIGCYGIYVFRFKDEEVNFLGLVIFFIAVILLILAPI